MGTSVQAFFSVIFDCLIIFSLAVYLYGEGYTPVKTSIIRCLFFLSAVIGATLFYPLLSQYFLSVFQMPLLYLNSLSFFLIAISIIALPMPFFIRKKLKMEQNQTVLHPITIPINFLTFFSFLILMFQVLFSSGISMQVKDFAASSRIISFLMIQAQKFEQLVTRIEGKGDSKTLQVLSVPQNSKDVFTLPFQVASASDDLQAENNILMFLNGERKRNNLPPFEQKRQLSQIARTYARDMIHEQFFSYETPDGRSLIDQIDQSDIYYLGVEESIIFSTHETFSRIVLNSAQMKQTLLSSEFTKIGVGVQDASSYGKIIVLLFIQ